MSPTSREAPFLLPLQFPHLPVEALLVHTLPLPPVPFLFDNSQALPLFKIHVLEVGDAKLHIYLHFKHPAQQLALGRQVADALNREQRAGVASAVHNYDSSAKSDSTAGAADSRPGDVPFVPLAAAHRALGKSRLRALIHSFALLFFTQEAVDQQAQRHLLRPLSIRQFGSSTESSLLSSIITALTTERLWCGGIGVLSA